MDSDDIALGAAALGLYLLWSSTPSTMVPQVPAVATPTIAVGNVRGQPAEVGARLISINGVVVGHAGVNAQGAFVVPSGRQRTVNGQAIMPSLPGSNLTNSGAPRTGAAPADTSGWADAAKLGVTGAGIGTSIAPGIGTAIGAGVGAIVGGVGDLLGAW